jgi:hypothetical protein
MNLVHNERIKLLATFINGIGVAVFPTGMTVTCNTF